jgi:hypothetical protein
MPLRRGWPNSRRFSRLWCPRQPLTVPLQLPPNCREVTAERVGTVVVIVGATKPPKDKPK